MKLTFILSFWGLVFFCSNAHGQPGDMPPNAQPGKCYAKALIPSQVATQEIKVPIYIGNDSTITSEYTVDTTIIIKKGKTNWEKRKAKRNYFSSKPNDSVVWCLVTTEEESVYIERYLLDTMETKEFTIEEYGSTQITIPGEYEEWREIVCDIDITKSLMNEIHIALGIKNSSFNLNPGSTTQNALEKYQRNNNLPIGYLDSETLKHMGIDW